MHRRHRLGSASQIRRVYASGVRVRSRAVSVTGIAGEGGEAAKVAVVASKRVGGAVTRNRARRRLRAALVECLPKMKPGTIAVVAATQDTPSVAFQKLAEELQRDVLRAGLIAADHE